MMFNSLKSRIIISFTLREPIMMTSAGLTAFEVNTEYFIIAKLFFIFYTDFKGIPFVIGHLFKFLSFWMIYQAIVQTTLNEPFTVLARASGSYDAIPHPAIQQGKSMENQIVWFPEKKQWFLVSQAPIKVGEKTSGMVQSRTSEEGTQYEDITIYPLIANDVEGAVIRIDNVTEHVRMQEMMIQSEKMLSVGGLAAGMAHEINNPLAGILQSAEVISMRLGKSLNFPANIKAAEEAGTTMEAIKSFMEKRSIPRMIEAITESGKRVAAIVDNMLSFARKSYDQVSSHDITDLLNKTLELAATDYDLKKQYDFRQIEIIKEYEENLAPVPCEGVKIQQVLLNILRNGAQAMHEEGTENPKFIIRTMFNKQRELYIIEIEDNGPGMDEETRRRVFEPFYTTKPVGVGTGLGLSVAYFIITENHRGELTVESRPGSGAKFIIRLPAGQTQNNLILEGGKT